MKMKYRSLLAAGASLFALALPQSVAQTPGVQDPVVVDADPALWVVQDEDTTVYLFGTVHILKPGLTWMDEAIADAFEASDTLVVEMIEPEEAEMMALVNQVAMDGTSLADRMPEEMRKTYVETLAEMKIAPETFDAYEPWFVAVNLSVIQIMRAGFDPESGSEAVLQKLASETDKPVLALETAEEQLAFFDTLTLPQQLAVLQAAIEEMDDAGEQLQELVSAWANGDAERLGELMTDSMKDDPAIEKVLFEDRNDRWADWIAERMESPGTVFLAVGSGHLAGPQSVQVQLAERDITSARIDY